VITLLQCNFAKCTGKLKICLTKRVFYSLLMSNVTAIILAAGYSSRMGNFKPLMCLGKETVLKRVIRLFQSTGIEDIRAVLGHRYSDVLPLLKPLGIRPIINEHYENGMFSSIVAGIKSLEPDRDAFFILPVDIPLVRRQTILDLLKAYRKKVESGKWKAESGNSASGDRSDFHILYPNFQGTRGHPPLIAYAFAEKILRWNGEGGLRTFLEQYEKYAEDVDVADEYILLDLDTPRDYQILLDRYERYEIPTVRECMTLMRKTFAVEKPILDHCQKVARVALRLGRELITAGHQIDLELVAAASLLHDLARKESDHAARGAQTLNEMGFPAVAEIVGSHIDIRISDEEPISAREIVYLADKLVQGDQIVLMEKRFREKMEHYANVPKASAAIELRFANAFKIKQRLETIVGKPHNLILAEPSERNENDIFAEAW